MTNHNFSHQNVGARTPHHLIKMWNVIFIIYQHSKLFTVCWCTKSMSCVLPIILSLSAGNYARVHAILQSEAIIEEISKQLLLSDGKKVGDCDAILVKSPGEIDSQHCSSAFNCVTVRVRAYFSLKGCLIFSSGTRFTQPFRRKQALDITRARTGKLLSYRKLKILKNSINIVH